MEGDWSKKKQNVKTLYIRLETKLVYPDSRLTVRAELINVHKLDTDERNKFRRTSDFIHVDYRIIIELYLLNNGF